MNHTNPARRALPPLLSLLIITTLPACQSSPTQSSPACSDLDQKARDLAANLRATPAVASRRPDARQPWIVKLFTPSAAPALTPSQQQLISDLLQSPAMRRLWLDKHIRFLPPDADTAPDDVPTTPLAHFRPPNLPTHYLIADFQHPAASSTPLTIDLTIREAVTSELIWSHQLICTDTSQHTNPPARNALAVR